MAAAVEIAAVIVVAVADNAVVLATMSERVSHIPNLGYYTLVVVAGDIHCFEQPQVSSAWNTDFPAEHNSLPLVRVNLEQDFAGEHIPMDKKKNNINSNVQK